MTTFTPVFLSFFLCLNRLITCCSIRFTHGQRRRSIMAHLNCVRLQRHNSRLYPSVWAGYNNEWKLLDDLSDEFDSSTKAKTTRKWRHHATTAKHGVLRLLSDGSHLTSQQTVKYGYFETCFQASDSSLRSSFSLISESDPNQMIRVFSYSATEQSRHRVTMDAVAPIKSNNNNIKYVANPLQKHIFAMPETPVIVGIDWTPENITTYVDGHVIRQMENKHWHSSMHIAFSLTSVISSNGRHSNSRKWWRRDSSNHNEKRPDRFEVYYVRCWHRFPDHRKLLAPGVEVSPTHYQKTTSSSTHRSVHYKKATSKHARISRTLGFGN